MGNDSGFGTGGGGNFSLNGPGMLKFVCKNEKKLIVINNGLLCFYYMKGIVL